jgi:hypothetical protein
MKVSLGPVMKCGLVNTGAHRSLFCYFADAANPELL